jgi:hypothetical protein
VRPTGAPRALQFCAVTLGLLGGAAAGSVLFTRGITNALDELKPDSQYKQVAARLSVAQDMRGWNERAQTTGEQALIGMFLPLSVLCRLAERYPMAMADAIEDRQQQKAAASKK